MGEVEVHRVGVAVLAGFVRSFSKLVLVFKGSGTPVEIIISAP